MILIAGLGNPAQKYADTRHNVGFMLIDEILKTGGFSELSSSKFQSELFKKGSLLLLKPQTFMNLSGNSVKAVNDFYKPERIIVVHDDIDLDLGAVKFKKGEPNLTRRSKFNAELKDVKFSAFCPFFLDCRMRMCRR